MPSSFEGEARERFERWLVEHVRHSMPAGELYFAYFDPEGEGAWALSPPISAEVARYWLRVDAIDAALPIGEALLAAQHDGRGSAGSRLAGAFPSEIDPATHRPRYLYDTTDNLTIIEALLDLHEATGEVAYLEGARRSGRWIEQVMSHGDRYGVWREAHAVPMKAATDTGDFDNRIAVGRLLFWVPTLRRLSDAVAEPELAALADRIVDFTARGQTATGGFFDHYDPGYPPEPYDVERFSGYAGDAVVADDSIRAALGLVDTAPARARAFARWLGCEDGEVPGYLDLAHGGPYRGPGSTAYLDLLSGALVAALARRLGEPTTASALLARAQSGDGGWPWAWDPADDVSLSAEQATLVGLWSLIDLSPR